MKPWNVKTTITNRINLKFVPFYKRIAKSNIIILKTEVHQIVGHFSGSIETDTGECILIDSMKGATHVASGKL